MRFALRTLLVLPLTLIALTAHAQEKGEWRASSKTAKAITGDVGFSAEKFGINFTSYTIANIRPVQPAELKAVFDLDAAPAGSGNLYRLSIPGATKFMHKNTLCGGEETQYMIAFVQGKTLQLAFFSGEKIPDLTPEAVATGTNLCGTYSYVR